MQHLINSAEASFALSACVSMPLRLGKHFLPLHRGAPAFPPCWHYINQRPGPRAHGARPQTERLSTSETYDQLVVFLLLWLTLAELTQYSSRALVLEKKRRNQAVTPLDPTFRVSNAKLSKTRERKKSKGGGGGRTTKTRCF